MKMLGARLKAEKLTRLVVPINDAPRMTGRKLQERRLKVWTKDPRCNGCGRLTMFPQGFQLDHIVPLYKGGEDHEDNCQVLCHECHHDKTEQDIKR